MSQIVTLQFNAQQGLVYLEQAAKELGAKFESYGKTAVIRKNNTVLKYQNGKLSTSTISEHSGTAQNFATQLTTMAGVLHTADNARQNGYTVIREKSNAGKVKIRLVRK